MPTEQPDKHPDLNSELYWSKRLENNFSLAGVGWLGLGEEFNRWMYAVRRKVFERAIRGRFDVDGARVLDVGTGTGFYVVVWRDLGARDITGSDLTSVAIERLRTQFPDIPFKRLDISRPRIDDHGPYDAISAMDVLFHIVDDDAYAQAMRNLAMLLAPGGRLIFTENLVHGETQRTEFQTSRTLSTVERLLFAQGLEIEMRRPMFVLMNTPIDSNSALLQTAWRAASALAGRGRRSAYLVGALLYPLDLVLTRVLREGPSTEIVVCRKAKRTLTR